MYYFMFHRLKNMGVCLVEIERSKLRAVELKLLLLKKNISLILKKIVLKRSIGVEN